MPLDIKGYPLGYVFIIDLMPACPPDKEARQKIEVIPQIFSYLRGPRDEI